MAVREIYYYYYFIVIKLKAIWREKSSYTAAILQVLCVYLENTSYKLCNQSILIYLIYILPKPLITSPVNSKDKNSLNKKPFFNCFRARGHRFWWKPFRDVFHKNKSPATCEDAVPVFGNIIPSWIHVCVTQRGTDVETFSLNVCSENCRAQKYLLWIYFG